MENSKENNGPDETKWNREQHFEQHREFNEGFSNENLPEDYNPSQMKSEEVIDENGNKRTVDRARYTDVTKEATPEETGNTETGNQIIEETAQNRDRNYDTNPERYPPSHPDNHHNRGNIDLGK